MKTEPYLPTWATAEEAADWLHAVTGQAWTLPRIVESGVEMGIELRPRPDEPAESMTHVFQGCGAGFIAGIVHTDDRARLAFARDGGMLHIFERPDGVAVRVEPPAWFPASEVRFRDKSLRAAAEATLNGVDLNDRRRVVFQVGDVSITEAGTGLAAFLALNGGAEGARLELLEFAPAPDAAPAAGDAPAAAAPAPEAAPPLEHWKMRVQAEAAAQWLRIRKTGATPSRASIRPHLVKWCRDEGVYTSIGVNPSDGYLRTHVLSARHWNPPE